MAVVSGCGGETAQPTETVGDQAVVEFTADPTTGQPPLLVQFTNNSRNASQFEWDFGDGSTEATDSAGEAISHEYEGVGSYVVSLTATDCGGSAADCTATLTIHVTESTLAAVQVDPATVTLGPGETVSLQAVALDSEGATLPDVQLTWEASESGSIDNDGVYTAGTVAGDFADDVTVRATYGLDSVEAGVSVTIVPGPPESVALAPVVVAAGEDHQLVVQAADEYGNAIEGLEVEGAVEWTVSTSKAGSVDSTGLFTAALAAGEYPDAIRAVFTFEGQVQTLDASLTIVPGALEHAAIAPSEIGLGIGMTQQFIAVGADKYGNHISDIEVSWSASPDAGTIAEGGLFTACISAGSYRDSVEAQVTHGGVTRSDTSDVVIEPDRIAFISERNDDQPDVYLMDPDGSNVKRLTFTEYTEFICGWSPEGHRVIYDSYSPDGGILTVNDTGEWRQRLIESPIEELTFYIYPSWSPDGTKVAFVELKLDEEFATQSMDLFIMDIDGGNITQVTKTKDVTEWVPVWSPDGTKLLYDHSPRYQRGDIYTIDIDGTNRNQLTSHASNDSAPAWSPDGTEIAFSSQRDGDYEVYVMDANGRNIRQVTHNVGPYDTDPSWSPDGEKIVFASNRDDDEEETYEIYVMNADGSDVTRLTNNTCSDSHPSWAPRKPGVYVNEASAAVPSSGSGPALSVRDVTAQSRGAIVRIEADGATGSGFVVDSSGLVLTNNHVVSGADEITVYLDDGTEYDASIRSRDMVRDMAVLDIDATDLPYLQLGDFGSSSLGDQVMVMGYSLDATTVSVTSGLISSVGFDGGRNICWIQTDSAINPGNSGGPLLNLQGQVIGVVSSKLIGLGIEGVGFAVSANTVNTYWAELGLG
jgi:Tol biopolymer transport system component